MGVLHLPLISLQLLGPVMLLDTEILINQVSIIGVSLVNSRKPTLWLSLQCLSWREAVSELCVCQNNFVFSTALGTATCVVKSAKGLVNVVIFFGKFVLRFCLVMVSLFQCIF